ncbi:MAG: hypothetical protein KAY50_10725 [Chitinophagaceae bacterium]|nr:hypothetical protein [Chitinophagaceae bacterium]
MKIVVISDEALKTALLAQDLNSAPEIVWLSLPEKVTGATCYIDLLFDYTKERINTLQEISSGLTIVNSVNKTCNYLPEDFVRINGWATFLNRPLIEAACINENLKAETEIVFSFFNKSIEWVPDILGFISPRVISMIINEAFFTLQDEVTGKEEIDIAMKLGTRYPFGPFEWSEKIGIKKIYSLLSNLSTTHKRYEPSELLKQEAAK